ncbi:hypothetical protein NFJ07_22400 [Arthrobacter sp. B2a2-09]|nr:hypothetical protein [Arthrobacter sp. B2a2-09]
MVPANALVSIEHDFASKSFFHQCAYLIVKFVLEESMMGRSRIVEAIESRSTLLLTDLFDENVCFLLISSTEIENVPNFSLNRILPSLVAYGFVPAETCSPAGLAWRSALPQGQKKLHLSLTSGDVDNHDIVSRLCVLAAISAPSTLMQFFYFYQIIEHLLEGVLRHRLPIFARTLIANLEQGSGNLHDEFLTVHEQMREKFRLKLLVTQYSDCTTSLDDLSLASTEFLRSLHLKEQLGIGAVYAVRNFLFHQARNLPAQGDRTLDEVVEAFAQFIPALLETYNFPTLDSSGSELGQ